jgi:hypothetical protein
MSWACARLSAEWTALSYLFAALDDVVQKGLAFRLDETLIFLIEHAKLDGGARVARNILQSLE